MNRAIVNSGRYCDHLLIAIFLCGLILPVAGRWAGLSDGFDKEAEKREPAPFPSLSPTRSSMSEFPAAFEKYLNDNLAFRTAMIRAHAITKISLLGDSSSERVILGQQGWWYYNGVSADFTDDVADYRGTRPLTDDQIDSLRKEFLNRRDQLAKLGITYVILVCPNKAAIYPEFLPLGIRQQVLPHSPMDQLGQAMASDGIWVDPRSAMLDFKSLHPDLPLFQKTDTHWTSAGAFVAYQKLCEFAAERMPGLRALAEADVTMTRQEQPAGGDLAGMLGIADRLRDVEVNIVPNTPVDVSIDQPGGDDSVIHAEQNAPGLPRLYMMRDSFGAAMIPFLAAHFSHATFVRGGQFDLAEITLDRPNLVVDEVVERRLRLWATQNKGDNAHEANNAPPSTEPTTEPSTEPSPPVPQTPAEAPATAEAPPLIPTTEPVDDGPVAQREPFNGSSDVLLRLAPPPVLEIGDGDQTHVHLTPQADGLTIHAVEKVPILILPPLTGKTDSRTAIVRVDITLMQAGSFRLFWLTQGAHDYNEDHVVSLEATEGRHVFFLTIPMEKFINPIRLDIGGGPGDYKLHSIEVRATK